MLSVKLDWKGEARFEGKGAYGTTMVTDAAKESGGGGVGYKPTELVLFGVAGCTGIDIVRILEKQRQKLTSLEIRVEAEQNDDYPKPFHTIRVHYVARGEDLDERRLAKAIELSESKYCVVSQTLQEPTTVTTSYELQAD